MVHAHGRPLSATVSLTMGASSRTVLGIVGPREDEHSILVTFLAGADGEQGFDGVGHSPVQWIAGAATSSLLGSEGHRVASVQDARNVWLDRPFGVEAEVAKPLAERPVRLADVDGVIQVLRVGDPGGHDHDVVVVEETVLDEQRL